MNCWGITKMSTNFNHNMFSKNLNDAYFEIIEQKREDLNIRCRMSIKINQMKLTNFQGIRNLELNFDGLNKSIEITVLVKQRSLMPIIIY